MKEPFSNCCLFCHEGDEDEDLIFCRENEKSTHLGCLQKAVSMGFFRDDIETMRYLLDMQFLEDQE